MITLTHLRKVFKVVCLRDPKIQRTEWHIYARDMAPLAHLIRAKTLLYCYIEGVKDSSALYEAMWHLACGVYKLDETFYTQRQSTGRRKTSEVDNEYVEKERVECNTDTR